MSEDQIQNKRRMKEQMMLAFATNVPHNRALGIVVESITDAGAVFRLPYSGHLVGFSGSGVVAGGAVIALLDGCSGAAVLAAQKPLAPVATLDLRVDYLHPPEAGTDIYAFAECFQMTRNVGFTRAVAYQSDRGKPFAIATGTFMLATKAGNVEVHRSAAAAVTDASTVEVHADGKPTHNGDS
jgi:uncharacterized protein (TIGR00369 family)